MTKVVITSCHCFTYGWNYSKYKFSFLLGTPWKPLKDPLGIPGPHFKNH